MPNKNNPIYRIKSSLLAFRKDPSFIYIVLFLIGFVLLMIKSNVYDPYYLNNYPSYTGGYIVEFYSTGRGSPRTKYCYKAKGIEYCGELAGYLSCHPNCKGNKFLVKYSWKKINISSMYTDVQLNDTVPIGIDFDSTFIKKLEPNFIFTEDK